MAIEHPRLKLGKSAAFVKTKIKRLPREGESWEADFQMGDAVVRAGADGAEGQGDPLPARHPADDP